MHYWPLLLITIYRYQSLLLTAQMTTGTHKNKLPRCFCLPIHLRSIKQSRFTTCLGQRYFLLESKDCLIETWMLFAGLRVHEHW